MSSDDEIDMFEGKEITPDVVELGIPDSPTPVILNPGLTVKPDPRPEVVILSDPTAPHLKFNN